MTQDKTIGDVRDLLERISIQLEEIRDLSAFYQKDIFTTEEAARFLGVTTDYIRRMASRREIPHYKSCGRLRFDRLELEEWMRRGRIDPIYDADEEADLYLLRREYATAEHTSKRTN